MKKKVVIIGGVAGGATTATRLRRLDEELEILVLERGEYISYANCGLPYHVGDVIKEREELLLQTPERMKARYNVDVKVLHEVTAIHREEKRLSVRQLASGNILSVDYDILVIATGSSPLKPPIPGIDGPNIFTLWTVPDTDTIKDHIRQHQPKKAAVIGGGFIGVEMAENLHAAGLEVELVEMMNQVMAPLDFEMAEILHENMDMNGVKLHLGDGVSRFDSKGSMTTITFNSGNTIDTDMVILSIGVKPNSQLAKESGLDLNERGGIVVDSTLRTSDPNIYAVGDVIQVENHVMKTPCMVPLAGPANKQARICANNILGKSEEYRGTQGTAIAKVFDLTAATVGMNEKQLKSLGQEKGQDYFTALINQKSHAGYYPGATPLNLKMIFDGTGKILGAQAVGQDGIDKRIDVLASAMRLSATVYDLKELELAYAPPFGSAKDPVNMLGFVAENVLEGLVEFVDCGELDRMIEAKEDFTLLDISESEERLVYAIPNSIHIPLGQLRSRFQELDSHKPIVVYCAIGVRSYNAARILKGNGFQKVSTLAGGCSLYKTLHYREWKPNLKTTMPDQIPSVLPREENEMMILNCAGLQCPGPIMKVNESLKSLEDGQILQVSATDMGFPRDVESWCRRTGNTFLRSERKDKMNIVYIQKGLATESTPAVQTNLNNISETSSENKTIIVFSGDLDKVLASFIIANGAAAMGRKVTMFFTFWGLNALRKPEKNAIKKPLMDKMFGTMMPRGASKLSLSNMNMGGMGTKMMKMVMKDKNVQSLEELMQQAMANGVHIMACTMSMDIMGITQEELIDGVELGGVATYLGEAEESNVNLFI